MGVDGAGSIGVFGGTFDPPHNGHVAVVDFLLSTRTVDRILVVPAGRPWLRKLAPSASPRHRLEMSRLAFAGRKAVEVLDVEVERPGPTYTVDTVAQLRRSLDAAARLVLILGVDSARSIERWHDHERLLGMCELLVVGRPGRRGLEDLPVGHPAANAAYVDGPMVDASATDIRRRILAGEDISALVPRAVARYIEEHGLYGAAKAHDMEAQSQ